MANSTFSGPVRSQNGFQELVDGVWTPVGGGGGGGGTMINVANPSALGDTILLDTPTEIGQTYTISVGWGLVQEGGVNLEVALFPPPEGADDVSFTGRIVDGTTNGSTEILGDGSFTYNFSAGVACALITLVYTGLGTVGGEEVYARFTVSGMAFVYSGG